MDSGRFIWTGSTARPSRLPSRSPRRTASALLLALAASAAFALCGPPAAGAAVPVSVRATPLAFSPNKDKVKDSVTVRVRLKAAARLFVGVYDPRGKLVATLQPWRSRPAGTRTYRWNGLAGGKPLGNARYTIRAQVKISKRIQTVRATVTLDTLAPAVTSSGGQLRLFAGGGQSVAVQYALVGGGTATVRLVVCLPGTGNARGAVVATTKPVGAKKGDALRWNGAALKGGFVATGKYAVHVLATDAAGNSAYSRPVAVVVYRPTAIHGTVTDSAGTPVSGAKVTVVGTTASTVSGAGGAFSVAACPVGFRVIAAKSGTRSGSVQVRVNMTTGKVVIVLGKKAAQPGPSAEFASGVAGAPSSAGAAADGKAAPRDEVTISGTVKYLNRHGIPVPMSGVRVVLQDDATVCWDDLFTTTSGQDGSFSFTYDYNDVWDWWGEADIRVVAYAQDGSKDVCGVFDGYWSYDPYTFVVTQTWEDNTDSHTGLYGSKSGDDRVAWSILDSARTAHDHWQQITGFDRPYVWVDYPADTGIDTGQFEISELYTCINIKQGDGAWDPAVTYHEYGHSVMYAAYDLGKDCNAMAAYQHVGFSFYETTAGKWYTEQDGPVGYDSVGGAWPALMEGFAEFFAAVMMDWDRGGMSGSGTFERNFARTDFTSGAVLDGGRIAHSVSRALWDTYDDSSTQLCCDWTYSGMPPVPIPAYAVPRPVGPLGGDDDDRLSNSGSPPAGATLAKIWTVLDYDWPASIGELRQSLLDRYTSSQFYFRGLDAALYSQGILRDQITENLPHINEALVTGATNADGSYRGTVKVWCDVTDPDSPGGDWDLNHVKIRLEWGSVGNISGEVTWSPLGFTLTRSPTPPPGRSGDSWFVVDWDTVTQSPCEIGYKDPPPGFTDNQSRSRIIVTGRTTNVRLRVIATDDLADSQPVELTPITVDNRPGLFAQYAAAPTYTSGTAIRWPAVDWVSTQYATYELWYKPAAGAWGTVAAISYYDPALPSPSRYPVMEIGVNMFGNVFFTINQPGTGGPGSGIAHTVNSTTVLQPGTWYHLAAQYGSGGQRLYVNGVAENSNEAYHGWPRPDSGSPSDPAFSLGQLGDWVANTALGYYEELKVSAAERHVFDTFPLPTEPYGDPDSFTPIQDHFDGSTTGTNLGFTFAP
jgi:Concanavalin A-like lectin/glucanases superfamily/Carboxypeptidase regulatory-like domain